MAIQKGPLGNDISSTEIAAGAVTYAKLASDIQRSGMKNRIINGDMRIDQRNAGASVTPTGGFFTVDRWSVQPTQPSKLSFQQNAGSVTPPIGFTNYLGSTSLSSYSNLSTDYFLLAQIIEGLNVADLGWGTTNAKTVTLSFQVYSSLTGTFGGSITNSTFNRTYPFSYSVPVANTWTIINITIAGDTTGTWLTNNNQGIRLYFSLGAGSTYSGTAGAWTGANYFSTTGATSIVSTSGATFYITGVQLEAGSTATAFEYRQYQQELTLCQRYYWKWNPSNVDYIGVGNNLSSNLTYFTVTNPVVMRANPTLTTSGTASDYKAFVGTTPVNCNAIPTINVSSKFTPLLNFSVSTALTVGGASLCGSSTANGYLGFEAEL